MRSGTAPTSPSEPATWPTGVVHAALFESLTQGAYEVRVRGHGPEGPTGTFEVEGGQVTTAQLR